MRTAPQGSREMPAASRHRTKVALAWAALVATRAAAATATPEVVVPFDLVDNRIVVDVRLDGKGPFRCILDTGASALISTETARAVGAEVADAGVTGGVGERTVRTGKAHLRKIGMGSAVVEDVPAQVMPFDDFPPVFGTQRIDAVLGDPIFERFVVTIDYRRHEVKLSSPDGFRYRGRGSIIAFERSHGIPVVRGTLDGVAARFGVDTGARSALLLYTPFVEAHGLRERYRAHVEGVTGWGIGGPVRSQLARAARLTIGPIAVRDLVIRLSTQKQGLTAGAHLDGLVGPDVLRRFRVLFDYSRHRMILEPNAAHGRRDTWDRLGAWFAQEGDHFVIVDVMAGSPAAEAGLHVGDRVLAVDREATSGLVLPEVRSRMRTLPPGTRVRLRVGAGNGTRELVAVLRDLV